MKSGAARGKLVLGIPTYGRSYKLVDPKINIIGSPSTGKNDVPNADGSVEYFEICQYLTSQQNWTIVQPNAYFTGPYAYRDDIWISFDDEEMARQKAQFVVNRRLGGIMFWTIDKDNFR